MRPRSQMKKRLSSHFLSGEAHPPETPARVVPAREFVPGGVGLHWPAGWTALLLALATLGLYWPATHYEFLDYDDPEYVTENAQVTGGLTAANMKAAFQKIVCSNWHPVTMMSHLLDCQLYGLNPWGHHLTSVVMHGVNTALVFLLLYLLTGARWRSLAVAALFGWHPLRVESVAWVAERKDVLSACFGLLALIFYTRYTRSETAPRKNRNYGFAFFCFALGLMSKPILVTWPFVMLLLDYWPLRRFEPAPRRSRRSSAWRLVREKIPFFALAAAASVMTYEVQKSGGAVIAIANLSLGGRAENALISYCRYLGKLFWPADLAFYYTHPLQWPLWDVLLAALFLGGISAALFLQRHRHPFLTMGWLWFIGTLVPVIGLIQVGKQAMADRYTYIPSLGILILAVWSAGALAQHWRQRAAFAATGLTIMLLCLALTRQQLRYWQDSETLFRHAIGITTNNYVAQCLLGMVLDKKGDSDGALRQFQEAIRLLPHYPEVHNELGLVLDKKGDSDGALLEFLTAVRLEPASAGFRNNLGNALQKKGRTEEALPQYQEAIRLKPDFAAALNNLGYLWAARGENLDQAHALIEKAVRLEPKNAVFLDSLGWVLYRLNRPREALDYLLLAIENSSRPDACLYDHLGDVYAALHQREQAAGAWRHSLAVEPNPHIQKKLEDRATD